MKTQQPQVNTDMKEKCGTDTYLEIRNWQRKHRLEWFHPNTVFVWLVDGPIIILKVKKRKKTLSWVNDLSCWMTHTFFSTWGMWLVRHTWLHAQRRALPWLPVLLGPQWSHSLYPSKLNNSWVGFAIHELGVDSLIPNFQREGGFLRIRLFPMCK